MNGLVARVRSFWRGLRRADELAAEMEEEMRFHIEMEAERYVRERGLDPEEAHRQAAIAFGGVEKRKEEGRDVRGLSWVTGFSLDLKLGARMLTKHPAVTVIGGMGIAIGVAITATVFSVLGALLDPDLPLDEGDRVVAIANFDAAAGDYARETHLHDLVVWREGLTTMSELGAYREVDRNVVAPEGSVIAVEVAEITASGFRIARVPPLLGRWLLDEDEREGALPVVVIGYDVWRDHLRSRPDAIGATLLLSGKAHEVVGVMPEGFGFPVNHRLWAPLQLDPLDFRQDAAPPVDVFGRVAPGATIEGARAQLSALASRRSATRAAANQQIRPTILPFTHALIDGPEFIRALKLARFIAGALLLVISMNVAVLVYARTARRTGEIAVRTALGASRARVLWQLFAEALVLATIAAAVGVAAAQTVLGYGDRLLDVQGARLPFWWDVGLSSSTVVYIVLLTVIVAAIVGVLPSVRSTGGITQATLRELGGGTGIRLGRTWTALVAVQVAVALSLLPLAMALPVARFQAARDAVSPVPLDDIVSARITLDAETPPAAEPEARARSLGTRMADRHAELVRRLEAEPGVIGVSFASSAPGMYNHREIEIDAPGRAGRTRFTTNSLEVGPGLFDLFGATRLAGRAFLLADLGPQATAAVVNQTFVEAVLGGGKALGRRFRYPGEGVGPGGVPVGGWYEIVGVVSDFPGAIRAADDEETVYHPAAALGAGSLLFTRVQGTPAPVFAGRMREIAAAVDPTLRLSEVSTVAEYLQVLMRPERMMAFALLGLAGSVLLFSAAGLHALVSFTVAQRRREIGIRVALGASPRRVLRSILSRGLRQISLGIGLGALVAAAVIPLLTATPWRTAILFAVVAVIMLVVGCLATLGPARRGLRIQPMEALRGD